MFHQINIAVNDVDTPIFTMNIGNINMFAYMKSNQS